MTQQKRTGLFHGALLLAGICNALTRTDIPFLNTLMFCLNFLLCAGLLLYWMQSVRARLLPTRARAYIVAAVVLMLGYLILRIFKYRIVTDAVIPARYAVYAYWTPQLLIPALFCMTCIRVRRGDREHGAEALLLIPACLLALLVLTNDLHRLVYRPSVELAHFRVANDTYTLGPGFWLLYIWMLLSSTCGIILLLYAALELFSAAPLIPGVRDSRRYRATHLTPEAIRQAVDLLPEGIAFSSPDGTVLLSNLRINELCRALTGSALSDAARFGRLLRERGEEQDGRLLIRTPSGERWLLAEKRIMSGGESFGQLTAANVTERYRIIEELREKNDHLQDIQRRMKAVSALSGGYVRGPRGRRRPCCAAQSAGAGAAHGPALSRASRRHRPGDGLPGDRADECLSAR